MRDETKCLHAGYTPKNGEPRVLPIVQSTTYVYDSAAEVAAIFDDPTKGLCYSRFGNPTVMAVEEKIAALEGGVGAMCTTSGQAATLLSILNICEAGDSIISVPQIYGGTINLFSFTLKKLGIECIYVDAASSDEEIKAAGIDLEYEVGTMIEIPRAALLADEIASEAEFFSFGTNDLTQMTFGFSRDDAGKFLNAYYESKIFENDPFAKLDQNGVGKLMEMTIKLGRPVNPNLHIGICGEHGGDPSSVAFCHKIGLDYVSCSPFRVPIARLAAAQAAIAEEK